MKIFINTKLKISVGQTKIGKYGLAAHKILQYFIYEQMFGVLRH